MTLRDVVLFLHILSAFAWAGGAVASTLLASRAARAADVPELRAMLRLERLTTVRLVTPAAVLTLLFGSWLVTEAGFEFSDGWIAASMALWVVYLGLLHGLLAPDLRRRLARSEELLHEGYDAGDPAPAAPGTQPLVVLAALDVLLVVFLYLMVFKPGA